MKAPNPLEIVDGSLRMKAPTPLKIVDSSLLPKIILFGDSNTQWSFEKNKGGFLDFLERRYAGIAEILNQDYAGYTSAQLAHEFRKRIAEASSTPDGAPPVLLLIIFLGAHDARILPSGVYVTLPCFEENIRAFVHTVLNAGGALKDTKIVLVAPPPPNIPGPDVPVRVRGEKDDEGDGECHLPPAAATAVKNWVFNEGPRYRAYVGKKGCAEKMMEIVASYEREKRVIGFDAWKALVDAALTGRLGDAYASDEERLTGGRREAAQKLFGKYFTHDLGAFGYEVVAKDLLQAALEQWIELLPEALLYG